MTKVNVTPLKSKQSLAEIYQTIDLRFSFVVPDGSGGFQEITEPAKCRDFLHDAIEANLRKGSMQIFGFQYDGSAQPLDMSAARYLLRFPDKASYYNFKENLGWLNSIETHNGLHTTVTQDTSLDGLVLLCESDPWWWNNTFTVSLHSFLLRILCYKLDVTKDVPEQISKGSGNESNYMKQITTNNFHKMLGDLKKMTTKEFSGWAPAHKYLHDMSGIVSLWTKYDSQYMKGNKHIPFFKKVGLLAA